jgi:serine/threonine protein kinase
MSKKKGSIGAKRLNSEEILLENTKKRKLSPEVPLLIEEKEIELEENIIGTGTFSKVYRGIYQKQTIAVKIFKTRVSDEDFMKEVTTLRNLPHQNIVSFIGYCNLNEERKIIMEFMERGTLFDLLHKGQHQFSWLEKLRIIKQVALAMKFLHSQNIAHCDLSSKNLLVGSFL